MAKLVETTETTNDKLDFRFADEEDANDIATLVNEAFSIEEKEKSDEPFAFRSRPRLNLELLTNELDNSQNTKWIVLETQCPEEDVVAAVAITMGGNRNTGGKKEGILRALSVLKSKQGQGIGNQILRKAESICRGNGCHTLKMDVCMKRLEIIEWLKRKGYCNLAGGAWMHDGVIEVTQYMSMIKDLTKPDKVNENDDNEVSQVVKSTGNKTNDPLSQALDSNFSELLELTQAFADGLGDMDDLNMDDATVEFGITSKDGTPSTMTSTLASSSTSSSTSTSTSTSNAKGGTDKEEDLESLLGSLMAQLQTPSGKQQFDDLVAAEERNVLGVPVQMDE